MIALLLLVTSPSDFMSLLLLAQSLAKMEVLTLLAKMVANFEIELAPEMGGREGVRSRESTLLTLQTLGTKGIRCHLHPRARA
jgi:hypothetical protein